MPSLNEIAFWLNATMLNEYPAAFSELLEREIERHIAEIREYALSSHVESIFMYGEECVNPERKPPPW